MRYFFSIILFLNILTASSQNIEEMRRQVERYEAEIAQINRLIKSNSKEQSRYVENQKLVNQRISNRKKIIASYDKQIKQVEEQLGEEGSRTVVLSEQRNSLRNNYSELIKIAYIHQRQNSIYTLLGEKKRLFQSARHVSNSSRLSEGLKGRIFEIDTLQQSVEGEIASLTSKQQELVKMVTQRGGEVRQLEIEKRELNKIASQLKNESGKLNSKIAENRQKLQTLQQQIASIVKQESRSEAASQIDWALSSDFEQNAGKLPLPITGGIVVDRFGLQPHPTQAGIKIENTGINLACPVGTSVNSVFAGEVRAIFPVSSMGNSVMIRHGRFLTVYSGLGTVTVKKGDKVTTGEKLGTIDTNIKTLHFEIWKETTVLDPEKWLNI